MNWRTLLAIVLVAGAVNLIGFLSYSQGYRAGYNQGSVETKAAFQAEVDEIKANLREAKRQQEAINKRAKVLRRLKGELGL